MPRSLASRWSLLAILALAFLSNLALWARQPLTFEERVKAQEAIERVYYNHRLWPKENPSPKPPFEEMVPKAQIEAKVTDYLKKSAALGEFWHRPITGEQLQAEMDRMAAGTKDPATLMELFAALGNDPYSIAEYLARPVIADRLIHSWYAFDERFHGESKRAANAALAEGPLTWSLLAGAQYFHGRKFIDHREHSGRLGLPADPAAQALDAEAFTEWIGFAPAPGEKSIHESEEGFLLIFTENRASASWNGYSCLIPKRSLNDWWEDIRGQIMTEDAGYGQIETGSQFLFLLHSPATCTIQEGWRNTAMNVPTARNFHSGVWTGSEMIVWGGNSTLNTGGKYNPATDSWVETSTVNAPLGREGHAAVWTGSAMIIWGGINGATATNTGGRYNPVTNSWTSTTTANAPPARNLPAAVWTGSEMIVWGGAHLNTGGKYDPVGNSWAPTSTTAAPEGKDWHTAVWTGSEMIVWGGNSNSSTSTNTGGRYNPATDVWTSTSTTSAPEARRMHKAVWTGTEMIVWGGATFDDFFYYNTGGKYDPSTDTWTSTSLSNAPGARSVHSAVWTGTEMVIWGGYNTGAYYNTGGKYNPSTNSWAGISTLNAPMERIYNSVIWTGSEMIVWGGYRLATPGFVLNTGGRYNLTSDSWIATSTVATCPTERNWHTAVWTGDRMVVWGGVTTGSIFLKTGGQYFPATDTWASTSTGANCPLERAYHTAEWTGTRMVVWGGGHPAHYNSGGQYDPVSDTWAATSTGTNVPPVRSFPQSVWTGTRMIVWGGWDGGGYLQTGGQYDPSGDAWTATSLTGAPIGRTYFPAVWTGSKMIVWGGYRGVGNYLNSGGQYDPVGNSWTATSLTGAPSVRDWPAAVWTGSRMVIWGGQDGNNSTTTGGLYDPVANTWTPTSTGVNLPAARYIPSTVWTGEYMIVWGGTNNLGVLMNDGGVFDPVGNAWLPNSLGIGAPSVRWGHTGVWTGDSMIVWGGAGTFGGSPVLQTGGIYTLNPISVLGASAFCPGGSTILEATAGYVTYQWILDGTDIGGANGQTYTATSPGTYSVRVTDAGGCTGTSSGWAVVNYPAPTPAVSGPALGCSAEGVSLTTGAFSSYQWSTNPGEGGNALKVDATVAVAAGNSYYYDVLASPAYTIQTGDALEYDLYITPGSPTAQSAVDLIASGWTLRGSGAVDQNGLTAHPSANLASRAQGKWYHRTIAIPISGVGKSLSGLGHGVFLAFEGDAAGSYTTYATNIRITNGSYSRLAVYTGGSSFTFPGDSGYSLVAGYSGVTESVSSDRFEIAGETSQAYTAMSSGSYSVAVMDSNGCSGTSAPFSAMIFTAVPGSVSNPFPIDVEVTCSLSPVLTWDAAGQGGTYDVYLNGGQVAGCQGISETSCAVANLPNDADYTWYVRATNGCGSTDGPTWSFHTSSGPIPMDLQNDLRGQKLAGQARLDWALMGSPAALTTHYKVYRSTSASAPFPASWTLVSQPTGQSYDDPVLGNTTTYYYDVRSSDVCENICPKPLGAFPSSTSPSCSGSGQMTFATFVSGGLAPFTYDWDFGDGTAHGTGASPSRTYAYPPNRYTATLAVTDSTPLGGGLTGQTDTKSFGVAVGPGTLAAVPSHDGPKPEGVAVNFQANASGGVPGYNYDWDFGDGTAHGTEASPSHVYATQGSYTVQVTVSDDIGCSVSPTVGVTVTP